MIRLADSAENSRLSDLAAILAAGYCRYLAQSRASDNTDHQPPNISDRSALYSLDTPRHKSDEWCAANAASHLTERG